MAEQIRVPGTGVLDFGIRMWEAQPHKGNRFNLLERLALGAANNAISA